MTCRRIRRPQRVKMENDPGHQKVVELKSGLKSYWHDSAWPERLRWKTLWCDWAKTQRFKQHLWLKLDCSSSCTEWHKQPFWGPFLFHTRPGRRGSIYKWNHLLKAEYGFYFYLNMTSLLFSVVFVICLFNKALTCHIFIWLNQNWDEMMRFTQDWYRSAGRSFYHILRQMYLCFLRQRASCVQTQQTSNQEVTTTTELLSKVTRWPDLQHISLHFVKVKDENLAHFMYTVHSTANFEHLGHFFI